MRLRDEHPLHHNERMDFYVLSRYDDIFHALRKPQIFSSAQGLTPVKDEIAQLGIPPTFIMMDGPLSIMPVRPAGSTMPTQ